MSAETPQAIIGTVSLGHFFSHIYIISFPALFPLLFAEFDVSYGELGLLVSVLYGAMFLFQIPAGWIIDHGHAKHALVGGLLLTAGGMVAASTAKSYPTLLAFAFVSGIGQSSFHPADYALINTVSTDKRTGRNFSFHAFAGYAGSSVAPLLVGGLGLAYGWRTSLLIVGLVGIVYALAVELGVETVYADELESTDDSCEGREVHHWETLKSFFRPAIIILFLFFVMLVVGESGIQSFTVVFLVETLGFEESTGNAALTAFFALASIGILFGGILVDRYDAARLAILCLVAAATFTFLHTTEIVPATTVATIGLFGIIGLAYGVVIPSRDRLVADHSRSNSIGKSFGVVFTGAAVGGFIGPVLIGGAIDIWSASVSMLIIGAFFFASAVIIITLIIISRIHEKKQASTHRSTQSRN